MITEGKIELDIKSPEKISKKLPVFYNPVMKLNRDVSIEVLNNINKKNMQIGLPLSGSGIRGLRFAKELKVGKIQSIHMNDLREDFYEQIKKFITHNKIDKPILLTNEDANEFLLNSTGFDYIDIDPFGSPNPFLDNSIKRLARDGILAVTATDTSALCGTYENACKRKYWAKPLRNYLMHEVGLRILIRKVQLIGSQYEKALTPILSYSYNHYMRVFFRCKKSKTEVDNIIKQHGQHNMFDNAGPMYLGKLQDSKLVKKINIDIPNFKEELDLIGFYDIHAISKQLKIPAPRMEDIFEQLKKLKYKFSRTHFSPFGIKSNIEKEKLVDIIKKI